MKSVITHPIFLQSLIVSNLTSTMPNKFMHCFPIADRTGEFPPFAKLPLPNVFMNKKKVQKKNKKILNGHVCLKFKKKTQKRSMGPINTSTQCN